MSCGAVFSARAPIATLPGFAAQVEAAGFDELWLAEDCFAHGGLSAAAAALSAMHRTRVGIGLLPVGLRNAALTAMEIATLADLFPGRISVAFGKGVEEWMVQVGARPRLAQLRQVVDAVGRLLAGDEVTMRSPAITLDAVALDRAPEVPPDLLVGTTGQRGIALAAELGVGLLLPEGAGPDAIRWVRSRIGVSCPITVYVWLAINDDGESARRALHPIAEAWRASGLYPALTAAAGIDPTTTIPMSTVSNVAVAGTPDECVAAIQALHAAGATAVAFVPVGETPIATLERCAHDVLPRIDVHM
jgi:alkanesulfonate monooxygenase SsuD/methylene tetrahydromethanopterin reductase-like flavin-dependent oxidoreductase (luciferase family)